MLSKLFGKPKNEEGTEAGTYVEAQAIADDEIYELVKPSTSPGQKRGTLVDATSDSFNTKDFESLREIIREKVTKYLYEDGKGAEIPINSIIERRYRERMREKTKEIKAKRHRIKFGSEEPQKDFVFKGNVTRRCCWDINKRGAVGETILHLCFLNNTRVHMLLAKELINVFPNLLHDVYLGDEYYGETVLHMAIANEDFEMISYIVEKGKEVNIKLEERCYGAFFCPNDQKPTRRDDAWKEEVIVNPETDYQGFTYWGEMALSFAACLQQENTVNLLFKNGVDIYAKDSNGNNVLHMMVIHNNKDMFNLANRLSKETPPQGDDSTSLIERRNSNGFTPLTLAAKLAKKELFDHILELKSNTMWSFGKVVCKEYPLTDLDSISSENGSIDSRAALNIVLSEESTDHLDMLDGFLYQLLHDKWKSYAKVRFYLHGARFLLYMSVLITVAYLHPGTPNFITSPHLGLTNASCYLPDFSVASDVARIVMEIILYLFSIFYLVMAATEIFQQHLDQFIWTLANAPTKAGFLLCCIFVIFILPCRLTCAKDAEDVLFSLSICTCIPYCLFFCRGFKLVGPFIVMIYKMIVGDLVRFLIIYLIFLMGFSQAMFVVFRGTTHEYFSDQFESSMAMFSMTLGEFKDIYDTFDSSRNPVAPKTLFCFYMVLVSILLLNMLIAMMGNTFNRVVETQKEWQRQWAKIVLVMEQSVSPEERMKKQRRYSLALNNDGHARSLVIRTQTTSKEGDIETIRHHLSRFLREAESHS